MKLTFNWLKEFVTVKMSAHRLAELLTMAGLEVESLLPLREPVTNREDWLFEIGVTPNRGDCLGIAGIALEVSAFTGERLKFPPAAGPRKYSSGAKRIRISINDARLCRRYSAGIVDRIRVGNSPDGMRYRLESCGIRAINNVVDITNYVMLETGQPLHAFDLDRLPTHNIVVRTAGADSQFTTLDGVERKLAPDDLLICAGDAPVALAGIMGGMDAEVGAETRAVLLESANFDATSIRRTAKRLGLHSEASHRFERGVDVQGTVAALDRAVNLLCDPASAASANPVVDRYVRKVKIPTILLREARIMELLGVRLGGKNAETLLKSLGLKTRREAHKGIIRVNPPARRPDLTREADLIEELARLHGYQKIPTTLPLLRSPGGKTDERLGWERRVRWFLAGEGLVEVINLPFTTENLNRSFPGVWDGAPVAVSVVNPLAKESTEMRLSLVPGLIENLRLNLAQKAGSCFAYHLGKIFRLAGNGASEERQSLAGLLFGARARLGLRRKDEAFFSYLDCKGLVEGVLELFHLQKTVGWCVGGGTVLHPGRSAVVCVNDKKLGNLGQIHPAVADRLGLPPFLVFELDFERLLEYAARQIEFRSLPRFPSVERDFALVVDRGFSSQQIISWIMNRGEGLIEDARVFDQYLGAPIPEGKKSLAYTISYRAADRTLTDAEINQLHQNLVDQIGKVFGARLRS